MPAASVAARAPAKINLFLRVVGRRADGYHMIESLVAFAGVHDVIEVAPADGFALTVEGPFAAALGCPAGNNLVLRAARALAAALKIRGGARIGLVKNLPVAAGIGGGSADAAATLKALCALWSTRPEETVLSRIGLTLGADVPVCLAGSPALMSGIGEQIRPLPSLPACDIVLVNPGVPLSTAAVFRNRSGAFPAPAMPPAAELAAATDAAGLVRLISPIDNDLVDAAIRLAPVIATTLSALTATPGCLLARLSGSGATCFGLYADEAAAAAAAARIAAAEPGWWTAATTLLPARNPG